MNNNGTSPNELPNKQMPSEIKPNWFGIQLARIVGIMVDPRRMLPRVTFQAEAWVPIVVVAIALAAVRLTMVGDLREEYNTAEFKEWYAEQRGVSLAETEDDIIAMSQSAPLMSFVEAPIVVVSSVAATTLVLFLIGRIGFTIVVGFRTIFGMVAWAGIVSVIPLILSFPLKLINSSLMMPTSVVWFMPESLHGSYIYGFLSLLDIFVIWEAWLLAIGMAFLFDIKFQRAVTIIGTMVILFAVLNGIAVQISK